VTKPGVTPRLIWTNQYTAAGLTMTRTHANIGDGTPGGSVSVEAGLMDMLDGTQTKECERRTKAVITTPGVAETTIHGNMATTTYSGGTTTEFIKPGQDAYIRVLKVAPGSSPPPGAISADETIKFIGPRVRGA
jgi:hypothetical protein